MSNALLLVEHIGDALYRIGNLNPFWVVRTLNMVKARPKQYVRFHTNPALRIAIFVRRCSLLRDVRPIGERLSALERVLDGIWCACYDTTLIWRIDRSGRRSTERPCRLKDHSIHHAGSAI